MTTNAAAKAHYLICLFIIASGLSFNILDSPYWKAMVSALCG